MKARLLFFLSLLVASFVQAAEPELFELHAVADKPAVDTHEYTLQGVNGAASEKVLLKSEVLLDSTALRSASVDFRPTLGTPSITLVLTETGGKRFAEITTKSLHQRLGIVLGGQLATAPVVNAIIYGGSVTIDGNFTQAGAADLVARLNSSVSKSTP